MTRRKKLALLKKGVQMLEPVWKEEALVPLERTGSRALLRKETPGVGKMIPVEKLKRMGLLGGGALLGLSLLGSAVRVESMRLAFSHELKRQLKPMQEKLERREKQNEALKAELERQAG